MPCDTYLREAQIKREIEELERKLQENQVQLVIGENGAIAFQNWDDRKVSDVCAYNRLMVSGSWALQQAIAAAEMLSGRQVNAQQVASGVHCHDGGKTWHHGH